MKNTIRNLVLGIMASALATCYFVGCTNSNQDISSQPVDTTSISDTLTPGIQDSGVDSFSIKYKYWYDNPDVTENQSNHLAATVSAAAKSTGFNFLDLDGLPIYQDSEGNEYIISGRTKVYLVDGKISGSEALLLRDEQGNKVYFTLDDPLTMLEKAKEFAEAIKKEGREQPETYEERVASSTSCTETSALADMPVYVNNIKTQLTVDDNGMIAIRPIYAETTLGEVEEVAAGAVVTMYTAAGFVKVTFTAESTDLINVEYSTLIEKTTLTNEDADVYSGLLSLTPDAIERILGYDVEVYDNFINIVTDNRDLFSSSSVLPYYDSSDSIDSERSVDIDDLDKDNPIPESKPIEKPKDETKPVENTDPSKVVNSSLVGHEYQNPDGTYSAEHVVGITIPGTNEQMTDHAVKVLKDRGKGHSNPSRIPYSEITVENAAEAFPYLGDFIGYVPDYIEIFPDMTREEIELAIAMNFNGLPPMNAETHEHYLYSSAEAWEAELARREENRKWQEETGKKIEEAWADEDHKIGGDDDFDDLTDEEQQQLLDRLDRLGY